MISIGATATSLAVVLFSVCLVLAQVLLSDGNQRFCGQTLTDTMDIVCVNGYNDKLSTSAASQKRGGGAAAATGVGDVVNDFNIDSNEVTARMYYPRNSDYYLSLKPFMANMFGQMLAKTRRRRDVGIYDECCRKACNYNELVAYCRPE